MTGTSSVPQDVVLRNMIGFLSERASYLVMWAVHQHLLWKPQVSYLSDTPDNVNTLQTPSVCDP